MLKTKKVITKVEYDACDMCGKELEGGKLTIVDCDDTDDAGFPTRYGFHNDCIIPVIRKVVKQ